MTTYQISYSGGMGSAVSALVAHEQGLDFNLIFADTLIEDEDLYRFNNDVASACGKEIITLTDGRTPWDVYADKRWIGNTRTAHCSTELKTKPVQEWLKNNARPSDPLVLGMEWSEQDRIERAQANWQPRPVVSLLNRYKITRPEFEPILKRHGIKKPDAEIMELLNKAAVTFQVVLTKADKPAAAELGRTVNAVRERLAREPAAYPEIVLTSAEKGLGIDVLRAIIAGME